MKTHKANTPLQSHFPIPTSRLISSLAFFGVLVMAANPMSLSAEDWHRVQSNDKKVSVLFPNKAETFKTLTDKTPAGSVKTEVSTYEGDGVLFTISDSKIPGLALTFAGSGTILKNAAASVVSKAFAKLDSSTNQKIDGAPGVVVRYEASDFKKKDHPGYHGIAIIFIVDGRLYTINSILSKESADNKAAQEKLLKSIQVGK